MNFRHTWLWLVLAAGLLTFIVLFQWRPGPEPGKAVPTLPDVEARAVTSLQVRRPGQNPFTVERTNDGWQLSWKPRNEQDQGLRYPAQRTSVETLLIMLQRLPAALLNESGLTNRFDADKNYGFQEPQATLVLDQGSVRLNIKIGANTPPGDQVFVQIVGLEGIYVMDAALLKYIPHSVNDWRDTTLGDIKSLPFDRIVVAAGGKTLSFQNDATNHLWWLENPRVRANSETLLSWLHSLERARVQQFVTDDPTADLSAFGLESPQLETMLDYKTNVLARFQFGKSPTNDPTRVYARLPGSHNIVTVYTNLVAPWASMQVNDYRDPYLLELGQAASFVRVRSPQESFCLEQRTNNTWRVLPDGAAPFAGDSGVVSVLFNRLVGLKIAEFTRENVVGAGLEEFGLTAPQDEYLLRGEPPAGAGATNGPLIADLTFGTNQTGTAAGLVYARRADELSVYGVKRSDYGQLPATSAPFRERRIWRLALDEVVGLTLRTQGAGPCQLRRNGTNAWSLVQGTKTPNSFSVEEAVTRLCELVAGGWVARGEKNLAQPQFGLAPSYLELTLELRGGENATVDFGSEAAPQWIYAAVKLDGQPWIFVYPRLAFNTLLSYLPVP